MSKVTSTNAPGKSLRRDVARTPHQAPRDEARPAPAFHIETRGGTATYRIFSPEQWAAIPATDRPECFLDTISGHRMVIERPGEAAPAEPFPPVAPPTVLSALFQNYGEMTELQVVGPDQDFPPPCRPVDPKKRDPLHPGASMTGGYRFRFVSVSITAAEAERDYERMVRHMRENLKLEPYPGLRDEIFARVV